MPSFNSKSIVYSLGSATDLKRNLVLSLTIFRHFLTASKVNAKFLAWFHFWALAHHTSITSSHSLPVHMPMQGSLPAPLLSHAFPAAMPLNLKVPQPLLSTPLPSQPSKLLLGCDSTSAVSIQLSQALGLSAISQKSVHISLSTFSSLYCTYYLIIVALIMGIFLFFF